MTKTSLTWVSTVVGLALAGCGSAPPPKQLVDARAAYNRASRSEATQLAPAELHEAKVALQRAEKQYKDDAKSGKTVDMAYIAQRKAELAETQAQTLELARQEQEIEAAQQMSAAKAAEETKGELEETRGMLESERDARAAAEIAAAEALARLAAQGTQSTEEERGTVITMPGTLMFSSGKAELRPQARQKLEKVATAIEEMPERQIIVEGHTDSTGSAELNMQLSEARANAVRDYLVQEGVNASQIQATGVGPADPVADNATPEGRAENRRVEIVIAKDGAPMQQPMQQPTPMPMP